jgi:Carboxypeptidase regulatory-like domain/TonB dependent receptor/TonB-dependent Receptor Plug Domain
MRRRLLAVAVLAGVSLLATALEARQGSASIRGRILDQQQAVMPGVSIVVTHLQNGTFRETVSSSDGTYVVPGLLPGPYRVTAELSGFGKMTQDVVLEIGATRTLDLSLQVATLAESITVSGQAPQVDMTTAQTGGAISSGELTELPSITRGMSVQAALLPGVQYNPSDSPASDSVSVNGQHSSQVNFVIDGGNNNDDMRGGSSGAQARPSLEALQEFQVITNQFDAEYGRSTGGIVNAVTKQGTNSFRGSAFLFYTNPSMTGKDFFVEQGNLAKPDSNKEQYGATLGGPIIRDRMHFFGSFERIHYGQGVTRSYNTRPDKSFSEVTDWNFYNTLARVDHQLNSSHTYSVRWLRDYQPNKNRVTGNSSVDGRRHEWDNDNSVVVTYNAMLGASRLNTLRASYTSEVVQQGSDQFRESDRHDLDPPTLQFVSFYDAADPRAEQRWQRSYQLDDTFSWTRNSHDIKSGVQYVYAQHKVIDQHTSNGIFTFPGDRDFNASIPSTYPERLTIRMPGAALSHVFTHSIGLFVSDKWQLTPKLTLSLGLRYDVDIAPIEERWNPFFENENDYPVDKNNIQPRLGFAYSAGTGVLRGGYGIFYEKLWTDRFEPFVQTGVYTNSFLTNFPFDRADPGPSGGNLPTNPLLVNGPIVNWDLLAQLYPPGSLSRNTGVVFLDTPQREIPATRQATVGYEQLVRPTLSFGVDYVHAWGRNLVLGYNLNPGLRVDTSRTGVVVRDDFLGIANQLGIAPFVNDVLIRETIGHSDYDGLNLQLQKRYSNNWSGRVSYTLGYARDNTGGGPTAVNNFQVLQERNLDLNQGPADTDRLHTLAVSGSLEVPKTGGLSIGGVFRAMSGRPFTIMDTSTDPDQNGRLFDPLPAGTYSGVGENAMTVENAGGRNGARGPGFVQLDMRIGYLLRFGANRTMSVFGEIFNVTNEANFNNPTGDRRSGTFLVPTGLLGGGSPRQLQLGARLGF